MELIFRPEAEAELLEAKLWYEARSPGLDFEFACAVEVAVESAFTFFCVHLEKYGSHEWHTKIIKRL